MADFNSAVNAKNFDESREYVCQRQEKQSARTLSNYLWQLEGCVLAQFDETAVGQLATLWLAGCSRSVNNCGQIAQLCTLSLGFDHVIRDVATDLD